MRKLLLFLVLLFTISIIPVKPDWENDIPKIGFEVEHSVFLI